jgi:hypothetical protein
MGRKRKARECDGFHALALTILFALRCVTQLLTAPGTMLSRRLSRLAFFMAVLGASMLHVDARTFTAKDGRTIEAEIVSFEADGVRIKRSDSGQVLTLPFAALAEDDQSALRAEAKEAAAKPKPLPVGSVLIELSRAKFASEKKEDVGVTYSYEQWGFNITLTNRSNQPLEKLRAEYVLFLDPSEQLIDSKEEAKLKRRRGQADVEPIAMSGRAQFRTDTVEAVKVALKSGWSWSDSDRKRTARDKLYGVWVRIYRGDDLIAETAIPNTLLTKEKWEGADTAGNARRF